MITPSMPNAVVPGSHAETRRGGWTGAGRVLAALLLLGPLTLSSPLRAQGPSFKLVVNESNPVSSPPATEVSKLFLKKVDRWEGGFRASPVDQQPESRARLGFSRAIHGKDVDAIKKYWRKMAFSGMGTPPPELESDAAVLDFVSHNVGGIGYVSSSAALVDRVKVLKVADSERK